MSRTVQLDKFTFANDRPLVLLGGINVLESEDLALRAAEHYVRVTERLGIPFVFKASFDKANRSSIRSFRGPGLGMPAAAAWHRPQRPAPPVPAREYP